MSRRTNNMLRSTVNTHPKQIRFVELRPGECRRQQQEGRKVKGIAVEGITASHTNAWKRRNPYTSFTNSNRGSFTYTVIYYIKVWAVYKRNIYNLKSNILNKFNRIKKAPLLLHFSP